MRCQIVPHPRPSRMDGEPSALDTGQLVIRLVDKFNWPSDIAAEAHSAVLQVLIDAACKAAERREGQS